MHAITHVTGLEILDSRGNPTLQATVTLASGHQGTAAVPSGASTGRREAVELRDGDPRRYAGRGVRRALAHLEGEIARALQGRDATDQAGIDACLVALDGTPDKSRLGANALLAASLACAQAGAAALGQPLYRHLAGAQPPCLPVPLMNVLNGGAHANNLLDIQECMIVPFGFESFAEALRAGAEVFHTLRSLLDRYGFSTAVGDEGGFAPRLGDTRQALDLILEAIGQAGYEAGAQIGLALDCAASGLADGDGYCLQGESLRLSRAEFCDYLARLVRDYPLLSIEDGMAEDDWAGWGQLTDRLGRRIQLVGDDLFVTRAEILAEGVQRGVANAILIKPNQVGTLSETLAAMETARRAGYAAIVSHRSGETGDVSIADLAVASACGQIKTGAPSRSERVGKYNRLLAIEQALGADAPFAGPRFGLRY